MEAANLVMKVSKKIRVLSKVQINQKTISKTVSFNFEYVTCFV